MRAGNVALFKNVQLLEHNDSYDSSNCVKGGMITVKDSVRILTAEKDGRQAEV